MMYLWRRFLWIAFLPDTFVFFFCSVYFFSSISGNCSGRGHRRGSIRCSQIRWQKRELLYPAESVRGRSLYRRRHNYGCVDNSRSAGVSTSIRPCDWRGGYLTRLPLLLLSQWLFVGPSLSASGWRCFIWQMNERVPLAFHFIHHWQTDLR